MNYWTADMDRRLLAGVAAGKSRGAMAKKLGVSRSAAIARYSRLQGVVFPCDQVARLVAKRRAETRRQRREQMRQELAQGAASIGDRDSWVRAARKRGNVLQDIARLLGVSRQRIHQIVTA